MIPPRSSDLIGAKNNVQASLEETDEYSEAVQKGRDRKTLVLNLVMPDSDPASPACFRDSRSRIKCGMTPFLDSHGFVMGIKPG